LVTANANLKLLDLVREVLQFKHYSIRTEKAFGTKVCHYIKSHRMRSREELTELLFVASVGFALWVFRDSLFLRKAAASAEQPGAEGAPA